MNDPRRPLPLSAVLDIVERRRRRRSRVQTVAGSALGVAAAGIAGVIVVTLRPDPAEVPAAARPPVTSSAPAAAPPAVAAPSGRLPADPSPGAPPPFDPAYLEPGYVEGLADSILTGGSDPEQARRVADAQALADAWGLELYPAAKAVAAKAGLTGVDIDPRDPDGDEELVSRFEQAGYTDEYAAELAAAWSTDSRTAKIVGALVVEAGCCG